MLINLSNHPSSEWSESQLVAARQYGSTYDVPFPVVPAEDSEEEIALMSEKLVVEMLRQYGNKNIVFHIMGEMTFTYAIVHRLRAMGFECIASTTERIKEQQLDGSFISYFQFKRFRHYE